MLAGQNNELAAVLVGEAMLSMSRENMSCGESNILRRISTAEDSVEE